MICSQNNNGLFAQQAHSTQKQAHSVDCSSTKLANGRTRSRPRTVIDLRHILQRRSCAAEAQPRRWLPAPGALDLQSLLCRHLDGDLGCQGEARTSQHTHVLQLPASVRSRTPSHVLGRAEGAPAAQSSASACSLRGLEQRRDERAIPGGSIPSPSAEPRLLADRSHEEPSGARDGEAVDKAAHWQRGQRRERGRRRTGLVLPKADAAVAGTARLHRKAPSYNEGI